MRSAKATRGRLVTVVVIENKYCVNNTRAVFTVCSDDRRAVGRNNTICRSNPRPIPYPYNIDPVIFTNVLPDKIRGDEF